MQYIARTCLRNVYLEIIAHSLNRFSFCITSYCIFGCFDSEGRILVLIAQAYGHCQQFTFEISTFYFVYNDSVTDTEFPKSLSRCFTRDYTLFFFQNIRLVRTASLKKTKQKHWTENCHIYNHLTSQYIAWRFFRNAGICVSEGNRGGL